MNLCSSNDLEIVKDLDTLIYGWKVWNEIKVTIMYFATEGKGSLFKLMYNGKEYN